MRKPRPEDFDPKQRHRTADPVDLSGVVPLQSKPAAQSADQREPTTSNVVSRYHGITTPSQPKTIFSSETDVIQLVRKAVKEFGKEAATHRFTLAEKQAVAEIVFAYRGKGIRTSENEIARIAINYLFYDYQINGEKSILHKALISLNQ